MSVGGSCASSNGSGSSNNSSSSGRSSGSSIGAGSIIATTRGYCYCCFLAYIRL